MDEDALFAAAMHGVKPVAARGRDIPVTADNKGYRRTPSGKGNPLKYQKVAALPSFVIQEQEDRIEGYRSDCGPQPLYQLRVGIPEPRITLDLHGYRSGAAHDMLIQFVKSAISRDIRSLLVVTGRGKRLATGRGILQELLSEWVQEKPLNAVVLAFCTAGQAHGGQGAFYLLLQNPKKNRTPIVWERSLSREME